MHEGGLRAALFSLLLRRRLAGGGLARRPPAPRRRRAWDTPRRLAMVSSSARNFGFDLRARLGHHLLDQGALHVAAGGWNLASTGDSSIATICLSSSSVNFSSSSGPMVVGRELDGAVAHDGHGLVDVLARVGLDRLGDGLALLGGHALLQRACRALSIRGASGSCTRPRAMLSMAGCWTFRMRATSSFFGGRGLGLDAGAGGGDREDQQGFLEHRVSLNPGPP